MKLEDVKDSIVELRSKGYGNKRIAKEINSKPSTVTRWMKVLGLPARLDAQINYNKECPVCGCFFETISQKAVFCSDKCRRYNHKDIVSQVQECKQCANEFNYYILRDFCGMGCKKKYSAENRKPLEIRVPKPLLKLSCIQCGDSYETKSRNSKFCTSECRYRYRNENRARELFAHRCRECGCHYESTREFSAYCSGDCSNKYQNRAGELKRRRRLEANGRIDWAISIERLIKRDGAGCYLCGTSVNRSVGYNHDLYPNIEHVVPVSKGGTHTWDNVKVAHRICNMKKAALLDFDATTLEPVIQ